MGYKISPIGFSGQSIEFVPAGLISGAYLLVNGQKVSFKGARVMIKNNNGEEILALIKPQGLGLDIPQLEVGGKVFTFVSPLKWYEWLWSGLPVGLFMVGGFIGALLGFFALSINTKIFRSDRNDVVKYLLTGVVSFIAVAGYSLMALVIALLLGE